ncbi:small secreted protein [Ceratobasidium sp. AG-I]|nr:small secreted protein [Ceratobasidium sp. AG-I]
MFAATGTLLNISNRFANDGKPPRYGLDTWEEMMMERDRRLTGSTRGQAVDPKAPEEFATNSSWYTSRAEK